MQENSLNYQNYESTKIFPPFGMKLKNKGNPVSTVILDTLKYSPKKIKKLLWKEYDLESFSRDEIDRYSILQSLLSRYSFTIPLENMNVGFANTNIHPGLKNIQIKILPLDISKLYLASNLETKKRLIISNPEYIPGPTLNPSLNNKMNLFFNPIVAILEYELNYVFKQHGIEGISIDPVNVKMISYTGGSFHFLVTDITENIQSFVKRPQNIGLANSLKSIYGENLGTYLKQGQLDQKEITVQTDEETGNRYALSIRGKRKVGACIRQSL